MRGLPLLPPRPLSQLVELGERLQRGEAVHIQGGQLLLPLAIPYGLQVTVIGTGWRRPTRLMVNVPPALKLPVVLSR